MAATEFSADQEIMGTIDRMTDAIIGAYGDKGIMPLKEFLVADELCAFGWSGEVKGGKNSRAKVLEYFTTNIAKRKQHLKKLQTVDATMDDFHASVLGPEHAMAHGTQTFNFKDAAGGALETDKSRFTCVLRKHKDAWKIEHLHFSKACAADCSQA